MITINKGVPYINHAEIFSENQDIIVATTGPSLQNKRFYCRIN